MRERETARERETDRQAHRERERQRETERDGVRKYYKNRAREGSIKSS